MAPCDQDNPDYTVGLLSCTPDAQLGFTLFAPIPDTDTWLIDIHGNLINHWDHGTKPGVSVYLEPNGNLLRTGDISAGTPFAGTGGTGGLVQELDWDGNILWEFPYASNDVLQHHDIERLPNGNVLIIAWEAISQADAIALGRDPLLVTNDGIWAEHLIEVDPATDDVVWEWHVLDHLIQDHDPAAPNFGDPADHPFRIDLNRVGTLKADWHHFNGIDYDPVHDHIVVSAHAIDEVWIIDHAPSTADAAGPAGDLLFRWGNPSNYGVGVPADRLLDNQHDPEFIPEGLPGAGNLLLFNNGVLWEESAAFELELPRDGSGGFLFDGVEFGPLAPVWEYRDPGVMYSSFIGGTQRLANGNTLITEGDDGRLIEVQDDGTIVWEYIIPVNGSGPITQGDGVGGGLGNATFRGDRYDLTYPAFQGRDLTPQGPIEL